MNLHKHLEQRTGWLFGTYRGMRSEITDPLFSVGRTIAATGREEYPSGIYVTLGDRGVYLSRADGLERGRAKAAKRREDAISGPNAPSRVSPVIREGERA